MSTPEKIRKVVTLGNLELWVCEAASYSSILGPAVMDQGGKRVGQLICFEIPEVPLHEYVHGKVSGKCVGCGELESHPIHRGSRIPHDT